MKMFLYSWMKRQNSHGRRHWNKVPNGFYCRIGLRLVLGTVCVSVNLNILSPFRKNVSYYLISSESQTYCKCYKSSFFFRLIFSIFFLFFSFFGLVSFWLVPLPYAPKREIPSRIRHCHEMLLGRWGRTSAPTESDDSQFESLAQRRHQFDADAQTAAPAAETVSAAVGIVWRQQQPAAEEIVDQKRQQFAHFQMQQKRIDAIGSRDHFTLHDELLGLHPRQHSWRVVISLLFWRHFLWIVWRDYN